MAEVIELNVNEPSETIKIDNSSIPKKSVNFGPGIELLMNDKPKKSGEPDTDIQLGDLNNLEQELNDLADDGATKTSSLPPGIIDSVKLSAPDTIKFDNSLESSLNKDDNTENTGGISSVPLSNPTSNLGKSTSGSNKDNKTWDGYASFNDIPINPDVKVPDKPKLTREEMLREKFQILRKLEDLERKGANLSKKYSMESSLAEMQGEYETLVSEREKKNSVQFQGKMLLAVITGLEFLNNKVDPFDLKLDGWSEQVNENIEDYDEIFSELHEKYKSKSQMAPELKLLFQLGGSAIMLHMTNSMFKSSLPNMDDILRQNPELMRQFSSAAANSMEDTNPGFSGFMSGMMGNMSENVGFGRRAGNDMDMEMDMPPRPPTTSQQSPRNDNIKMSRMSDSDGINIAESFANAQQREKSVRRPKREEMKGPGNISDLLSGLKTKKVNIGANDDDNNSVVSITELTEREKGLSSSAPKKSRRRTTSEKNSISLDI